MRIANNIIFIAVVSLAACIEGWQRGTRSMTSNESLADSYEDESPERNKSLRLKPKDYLLRNEVEGQPVECCPSILEMVEPLGGKDDHGNIVQLYRDNSTKQRFHDISCRSEVVDKPCRFLDSKLHASSRCVQKYSFSYAIIKTNHEHLRHAHHSNSPSSGSNWTLGYVQVRSGCACEVIPKTKRKRSSHRRNRKGNHIHHKKSYEDLLKA